MKPGWDIKPSRLMEIVGISQEAVRTSMQAVNIKVYQEGYSHITKKHWQIVPDVSVYNCFEKVSLSKTNRQLVKMLTSGIPLPSF